MLMCVWTCDGWEGMCVNVRHLNEQKCHARLFHIRQVNISVPKINMKVMDRLIQMQFQICRT